MIDIEKVLRNRYYPAASVACKLSINWATLSWSALAIVKPDVLADTIFPTTLSAWLLLLLSVAQTFWLCVRGRPLRGGSIGYAFMGFYWCAMLVMVALDQFPTALVRSFSIAAMSTVVLLAAFAFASNPRAGKGDNGLAD